LSNKKRGFEKKYYFIIMAFIAVGFLLISLPSQPQRDVPVNSYVDDIITECKADVDCAIGNLIAIADKENQSTVLKTLDGIISHYEKTERYCHTNAHHLGMFMYDYLGDVSEAFSLADQRCAGAIYHGIMQRYIVSGINRTSIDDIDISKICPKNITHPYSLSRWECLHGMGHGLIEAYNFDVFVAVERCDELDPGWEQITCSKGIFMGNVGKYFGLGLGSFDENDIYFPCNSVDEKYAPTCYNYHASYILAQPQLTLTESFKVCENIIPEEFAKYCYFGMGRQLSYRALDNIDNSLAICQSIPLAYQSDCYTGIALVILDLHGIDLAMEYCKILPEQFKADCYDAVGKWIKMLHPASEARTTECSKAENGSYFDICINADLQSITIL